MIPFSFYCFGSWFSSVLRFAPITNPQIGHLYSNVLSFVLLLIMSFPHLGHFIVFCSFFTYYHISPLRWCMDALLNFFNNLVNLLLTMVHHFGIVKLQGGSPLRISSLKNTYTKPIALMQSAPLVIICEDVYRS